MPPGTAPYFYLGHWEWGSTPAQTLPAIFQPRADCRLLERREYSYAYEGSEEHLVVKEDVWTSPESSSPNSYYQTTRENNGLGLPWKVLGPLTSGASGFRELRLTSYDALARAVSWSVGSEGGSDLVVVRRVAYDGGEPGGGLVVGDGHLTRSVAYRGEQASPDEETRYDFDWRGLAASVWEGYDASSGTAVVVTEYARDYRGRVVEEKRYAGHVASENLRARSKTLYDERGRVYETQTYGVGEDGAVIGDPNAPDGDPIPLRARTWYDARGYVLKRLGPDSTFRKFVYDGLGRVRKEYFGFDVDESSYSEAGSVSGDTTVEETVRTLDRAGNAVFSARYVRYPGTSVGDLEPQPKTERRPEYRAFWYGALGRLEVERSYGDGGWFFSGRPAVRPSATSATVEVMKRKHPLAG